jgi:hypothetical protein
MTNTLIISEKNKDPTERAPRYFRLFSDGPFKDPMTRPRVIGRFDLPLDRRFCSRFP